MDAEKFPQICCTCPPSDLNDNEIEIQNSGTSEQSFEEEVTLEAEEKLDPKKIQRELMCIKSVIEKYQKKLRIYLDPCPDEPCIDFTTELTCSQNKEICALQRSKYKLECQIKELENCCKIAKQQFKTIRSMLCGQKQEITELQKHIAVLESWRRQLELEAGLCIERFEYLKNVKAEWSDVTGLLEKEKLCYKNVEKNLVTKDCYVRDKQFFMDEIKRLNRMFMDLYELERSEFEYPCGPDTPPRLIEFKFAESEYMNLKSKFLKLKKGNDDEKEFECVD